MGVGRSGGTSWGWVVVGDVMGVGSGGTSWGWVVVGGRHGGGS